MVTNPNFGIQNPSVKLCFDRTGRQICDFGILYASSAQILRVSVFANHFFYAHGLQRYRPRLHETGS